MLLLLLLLLLLSLLLQVSDLLLRVHAIFPQKDLLLRFLEDLAAAAGATGAAAAATIAPSAAASSSNGTPHLLAKALHAPVPFGLLGCLQETVAAVRP